MAEYFYLNDHSEEPGWGELPTKLIGEILPVEISNSLRFQYEMSLAERLWYLKEEWLTPSTREEFVNHYPNWNKLEEGRGVTLEGKEYTIVTKNEGYARFVDEDGKEIKMDYMDVERKIEATSDIVIPTIMNMEPALVEDVGIKNNIIEEMKILFNEYDYDYNTTPLEDILDEWNSMKGNLRAILRNHPDWDENLQMIKLEKQPFTKEISWKDVDDCRHFFYDRLREWLRNNELKIGFFKYGEFKEMYDRLMNKKHLMNDCEAIGIRAKYNGMNVKELKIEIDKMGNLLAKATDDSIYFDFDFNRYRFSTQKYLDAIYLISVMRAYANIVNDRGKGYLDEKGIFTQEGVENVKSIITGSGDLRLSSDKYDSLKAKLKPQVGQSLPKWIGKVCVHYGFDKYVKMETKKWYDDAGEFHSREYDAGYNKYRALLGDAFKTDTYEDDIYISINPLDYLTMSFLYNATSCQSIDKEDLRNCHNGDYQGCYSSATVSLMIDDTSLIMHTIKRDGDKVYRIGKEADPKAPVYRATKFRRMIVYAGEDKLICSRLYPDGRDGGDLTIADQFRNIIQKVFADCLHTNNTWKLEKGKSKYVSKGTYATCYPDWENYDDCSTSFLRGVGSAINYKGIIAGREPICICCGDRHSTAENIMCDSCRTDYEYYCEHCGQGFSEDNYEAVWTEDGNVYCCPECAERDGYHYAFDVEEWCWGEDCMYCEYNDGWFYRTEDAVFVDNDKYTFVDDYAAERFGCEWSDYDECYTYDHDVVSDCLTGETFIPDYNEDYVHTSDECWFINEDNAIEYGYILDEDSGDWVIKADEDEEVA